MSTGAVGRTASRPQCLVLVVGTATEIGKTWTGVQVLAALRKGATTVAARKPAQSFDPSETGPTDAEALAAATGESPAEICPPWRSYPVAMAPPMAAAALGLAVPTLEELLAELAWPDPPVQVGWLETVGGPRSPIALDADAVTLAERLQPDVVLLVADAGLGTVNAVLSSVEQFDGIRPVVFLNRYDDGCDLHRRNLEWLRTREGLGVVTDTEALVASLRPKTP